EAVAGRLRGNAVPAERVGDEAVVLLDGHAGAAEASGVHPDALAEIRDRQLRLGNRVLRAVGDVGAGRRASTAAGLTHREGSGRGDARDDCDESDAPQHALHRVLPPVVEPVSFDTKAGGGSRKRPGYPAIRRTPL